MKKEAEEASDKKKLKVVKQALIETRQAKEDLEKELNALKTRNRELEKENADTSNKYLRLYDENDKLQEVLQNLQYQLTSGTGAKVRMQTSLSVDWRGYRMLTLFRMTSSLTWALSFKTRRQKTQRL